MLLGVGVVPVRRLNLTEQAVRGEEHQGLIRGGGDDQGVGRVSPGDVLLSGHKVVASPGEPSIRLTQHALAPG